MNVQIEESWKAHLQPEFEKDYFRTLTDFVRDEYGKYAIYPPGKEHRHLRRNKVRVLVPDHDRGLDRLSRLLLCQKGIG